jgi:hypothetical protein
LKAFSRDDRTYGIDILAKNWQGEARANAVGKEQDGVRKEKKLRAQGAARRRG